MILTSSSTAVMDAPCHKEVYDETDWTDPGKLRLPAYARSKTLAERAAWDFVGSEAPDMRLSVINPTFVQGAPLGGTYGTSVKVIERLMTGKDPMLPRFGFACCDVGDVAEAHIRAMDRPEAAGRRHIIFDRFMWITDIADVVRRVLLTYGNTVSFQTLYARTAGWVPDPSSAPPLAERP